MCQWRCSSFYTLKPPRAAWQNREVYISRAPDAGCGPSSFLRRFFKVKAAIFLGLIGVAIGLLAILLSLGLLGSAPSSKPPENSWLGVLFGIAVPFRRYLRHHSRRSRARIPDYCRITGFVADLASIAPYTTRSWHYHLPRHHVHVGRNWTGQESIHRERRDFRRNCGTHRLRHRRNAVLDCFRSVCIYKTPPSGLVAQRDKSTPAAQ